MVVAYAYLYKPSPEAAALHPRKNKSEMVQARRLVSPCPQVLSCGRSWAGLPFWGLLLLAINYNAVVLALQHGWSLCRQRLLSSPLCSLQKALCWMQGGIKATKERYLCLKHNTSVIIPKLNKNHNLTVQIIKKTYFSLMDFCMCLIFSPPSLPPSPAFVTDCRDCLSPSAHSASQPALVLDIKWPAHPPRSSQVSSFLHPPGSPLVSSRPRRERGHLPVWG